MLNILTVIRCECKLQITRLASWGVFLAALVLSLWDAVPSAGNLRRLEFLADPAYFVCRTMRLGGLPLAFGTMILLSDRFSADRKTGVKSLIMASPVTTGQYILGKLLGGLCHTAAMFSLFLAANALAYCLAAPFPISVSELVTALAKATVLCVLPVSVFIGFVSVGLPALTDVRLFYAAAAALFIADSSTVGTAEAMPFYCITSGDLTKLIWQHPRWPFTNAGSTWANLAFLVGSGLAAWLLLSVKSRSWRHE